MVTQCWELLPQHPGGNTFQTVDERGDTHLGGIFHKKMHMIPGAVEFGKNGIEVGANPGENFVQGSEMRPAKAGSPVFGHEDQVDMHPEYAMSTGAITDLIFHRPMIQ